MQLNNSKVTMEKRSVGGRSGLIFFTLFEPQDPTVCVSLTFLIIRIMKIIEKYCQI